MKPVDDNLNLLLQQLWDLSYGLLDDEEAARLLDRVERDPEVAALHQQVQRDVRKLAVAARWDAAAIPLRDDQRLVASGAAPAKNVEASGQGGHRRWWRRWDGRRLFSAAAVAAVLLLSIAPWTLQRLEWVRTSSEAAVSSADASYLTVIGPPRIASDAPVRWSVVVHQPPGQFEKAAAASPAPPSPADATSSDVVEYRFKDAQGDVVALGETILNSHGYAEFVAPPPANAVNLEVASVRVAAKLTWPFPRQKSIADLARDAKSASVDFVEPAMEKAVASALPSLQSGAAADLSSAVEDLERSLPRPLKESPVSGDDAVPLQEQRRDSQVVGASSGEYKTQTHPMSGLQQLADAAAPAETSNGQPLQEFALRQITPAVDKWKNFIESPPSAVGPEADGEAAQQGELDFKQRDPWSEHGRFSQESFAVGDTVTYEIEAAARQESLRSTFAARAGQTPLEVASQESPNRGLALFFQLPQDASAAELLIVHPQEDRPAAAVAADRITRLNVPIHDGRVKARVDVEGGAVALAAPNRLRLETRDMLGRRTPVRGRLEDSAGRMLSRFETDRQGQAIVEVTPHTPQVRLNIDHPPNSGGKLSFDFPLSPATLRLDRDLLRDDEPLSLLLVGARDPSRYWVDVSRGDHLVGRHWGGDMQSEDVQEDVQGDARATKASMGASFREISLGLPADSQGLMQAALYALDQKRDEPIASRWFYRFPRQRLEIRIGEHNETYAPGDTVDTLRVFVSDEEGRSVDAATHVLIAHQDDVAVIQERVGSELSQRFFPDLDAEQANRLTRWIMEGEPERLSWWLATRPSELETVSKSRSNQAETRLVASRRNAERRAQGLAWRRWLHGGSAAAALVLLAVLVLLMLRQSAPRRRLVALALGCGVCFAFNLWGLNHASVSVSQPSAVTAMIEAEVHPSLLARQAPETAAGRLADLHEKSVGDRRYILKRDEVAHAPRDAFFYDAGITAKDAAPSKKAGQQTDSHALNEEARIVLDHHARSVQGALDVTVSLPPRAGAYVVFAVAEKDERFGFGRATINVAEPTQLALETPVELTVGDWLDVPEGSTVDVTGGLTQPRGQSRVLAAKAGPALAAITDSRTSPWAERYQVNVRPLERELEALVEEEPSAAAVAGAQGRGGVALSPPKEAGEGSLAGPPPAPLDAQNSPTSETARAAKPAADAPTAPGEPLGRWDKGPTSSLTASVVLEPRVGAADDDFRLQVKLSAASADLPRAPESTLPARWARIEIGLPGGLAATATTIASLESQGARCRLLGSQLVIDLAVQSGDRRALTAPLFAKLRGSFTGTSPKAYFLGESERRTEAPPLHVEIR